MPVLDYEPHTWLYDNDNSFKGRMWRTIQYGKPWGTSGYKKIYLFKAGTPVLRLSGRSMPVTRSKTVTPRGRKPFTGKSKVKRTRNADFTRVSKNLFAGFGRRKINFKKGIRRTKTPRVRSRTVGGRQPMPGMYQGRFNVGRGRVRTSFDKYHRTGVVQSTETIGVETDKNCCYMMNEVINSRDLIYLIAGAMLRKLLEKANFRVEGADMCPINVTGGASNEPKYYVTTSWVDKRSDALTEVPFEITTSLTFGALTNLLAPYLQSYSAGFNNADDLNVTEPYKLTLWRKFVVSEQDYDAMPVSTLLYNETFIELFGTSELKVQNRSLADSATDPTSAENVSNNPLQGWAYLFNGVPKPKGNGKTSNSDSGRFLNFERMNYPNGISTWGGTDSFQGLGQREPPVPRQFWNCKKAYRIRLEPGNIKKFSNAKYKSGNVLKMLKCIRLQLDDNAYYATYSIFPVQLVALEDVLNGDPDSLIKTQYEIERKLGVRVIERQKKFFESDFAIRQV